VLHGQVCFWLLQSVVAVLCKGIFASCCPGAAWKSVLFKGIFASVVAVLHGSGYFSQLLRCCMEKSVSGYFSQLLRCCAKGSVSGYSVAAVLHG
jgi:hypothetical protein